MLGSRVTPWSSPWPPTDRTDCFLPSGQSEASGNDLKWFPFPKNLVLKKSQVSSMLGSRVTPWSSPWPPTARTDCFLPSGQSEASGNDLKWFPFPKNLVLKKSQVSSMLGSRVTPWSSPWPPTARTGCSQASGLSEASGNGWKWFPMPPNPGLDTKIKSLAFSEAELLREELHRPLRTLHLVCGLHVDVSKKSF